MRLASRQKNGRKTSTRIVREGLLKYTNIVLTEVKEDYSTLKEALLQTLGMIVEQYKLDIWSLHCKVGRR